MTPDEKEKRKLAPKSFKPSEIFYSRNLIKLVQAMRERVIERQLPRLFDAVYVLSQTPDSASYAELSRAEIINRFQTLESKLQAQARHFNSKKLLATVAERVFRQSVTNFKEQFRKLSGVPFTRPINEQDFIAIFQEFRLENEESILKLSTSYTNRLIKALIETPHKSLTKSKVQEILNSVYKIQRRAAYLLAVNSVQRLNSKINERLQKEIGLKTYIWRTQLDDRVRDHHAEREGKEFSWLNPPAGGHAGSEWGCRCYSQMT